MAKTARQKAMANASRPATAAEGSSATPPISVSAAYVAFATSKGPAGSGGCRPSGTRVVGKEVPTEHAIVVTAYAAPLPVSVEPAEVCQTAAKRT